MKPFYDGSTHDLSLATPQQEDSSAMLNCGQSNVYVDDMSHMGPSHEVDSISFFIARTVCKDVKEVWERGETAKRGGKLHF